MSFKVGLCLSYKRVIIVFKRGYIHHIKRISMSYIQNVCHIKRTSKIFSIYRYNFKPYLTTDYKITSNMVIKSKMCHVTFTTV